MHDLKTLLHDIPAMERAFARRGHPLDLTPLAAMIHERAQLRMAWENGRAQANRGQGTPELKQQLTAWQDRIAALDEPIDAILLRLPNLAHEDTPDGLDAAHNREVFRKEPLPAKAHPPLHHADMKGIDLHPEIGAALTGARFHVWGPGAARMGRKLMGLAMDYFGDVCGYEEHAVPLIVHQRTLQGTGQWPKFAEEVFALQTEQPWYLIPTGEVPLTNIVAETTLHEKDHPTGVLKMMTATACFRQEAGAAGRDTRGLIRQHQFDKLELVNVVAPDKGQVALDAMLADVMVFLDTLPLAYRVVELCAGDMGFAGHRAYDIEAWFAGAGTWREIATLTWCHDFQARRMRTYWKDITNKKQLAHTLNGTGLALGRVFAALAETWWNPETARLELPEEFLERLG